MLRGYRCGVLIFVVISMFLSKHALTANVSNISGHKLGFKTVTLFLSCLLSAYNLILGVSTFCYLLHLNIMWLELYPPKSKRYTFLMSFFNYSLAFVIMHECIRCKFIAVPSNAFWCFIWFYSPICMQRSSSINGKKLSKRWMRFAS